MEKGVYVEVELELEVEEAREVEHPCAATLPSQGPGGRSRAQPRAMDYLQNNPHLVICILDRINSG